MGGGAAVVGLAACGDDGNDGVGPMARTTDTTAESASAAAPTVDPRSVSIVPQLTRLADLELAGAARSTVPYAPDVPPPITRTDQRIVEFSIDVLRRVRNRPRERRQRRDRGFRIGGDNDVAGVSWPGAACTCWGSSSAKITVTNSPDSANPHNIDFHAVTGQGGGAAGTGGSTWRIGNHQQPAALPRACSCTTVRSVTCRCTSPTVCTACSSSIPNSRCRRSIDELGRERSPSGTSVNPTPPDWASISTPRHAADSSTLALRHVQRPHRRPHRRQLAADERRRAGQVLHGQRRPQSRFQLPPDRLTMGPRVPGRPPPIRSTM